MDGVKLPDPVALAPCLRDALGGVVDPAGLSTGRRLW
jgi:hypothetical protein